MIRRKRHRMRLLKNPDAFLMVLGLHCPEEISQANMLVTSYIEDFKEAGSSSTEVEYSTEEDS